MTTTTARHAARAGRALDRPAGRRRPARLARRDRSTTAPAVAASWCSARSTGEERDRLACVDCGHIAYVNPRLVVSTIPVTDAGEVVLLRRGFEPGRGWWAQPGGFLEVDETPTEGAVRETLEETGLVVEPGEIIGLYARLEAAVIVLAYEARIVGGERARARRRSRSGRSRPRPSRGPRSRSGPRGGRSSTGSLAAGPTCAPPPDRWTGSSARRIRPSARRQRSSLRSGRRAASMRATLRAVARVGVHLDHSGPGRRSGSRSATSNRFAARAECRAAARQPAGCQPATLAARPERDDHDVDVGAEHVAVDEQLVAAADRSIELDQRPWPATGPATSLRRSAARQRPRREVATAVAAVRRSRRDLAPCIGASMTERRSARPGRRPRRRSREPIDAPRRSSQVDLDRSRPPVSAGR